MNLNARTVRREDLRVGDLVARLRKIDGHYQYVVETVLSHGRSEAGLLESYETFTTLFDDGGEKPVKSVGVGRDELLLIGRENP